MLLISQQKVFFEVNTTPLFLAHTKLLSVAKKGSAKRNIIRILLAVEKLHPFFITNLNRLDRFRHKSHHIFGKNNKKWHMNET